MFHNAFISFRCHPKAVHAYLLPRFHPDEGVASDELFGLGEWPIDHGAFFT